jgi:hypothetical protein
MFLSPTITRRCNSLLNPSADSADSHFDHYGVILIVGKVRTKLCTNYFHREKQVSSRFESIGGPYESHKALSGRAFLCTLAFLCTICRVGSPG